MNLLLLRYFGCWLDYFIEKCKKVQTFARDISTCCNVKISLKIQVIRVSFHSASQWIKRSMESWNRLRRGFLLHALGQNHFNSILLIIAKSELYNAKISLMVSKNFLQFTYSVLRKISIFLATIKKKTLWPELFNSDYFQSK